VKRLELIRNLTDMNDRLLEDIGITRSDIRAVADGEIVQKNENARSPSTLRKNRKIGLNYEPATDDNEREGIVRVNRSRQLPLPLSRWV